MKYIDTHGTVIVAGFPGVGKSWCFNNQSNLKVIDSDSSDFSHYVDINGERKIDPNFPDNYLDHIKKFFGEVDIIFISTHKVVRDALTEERIPYVLVFPEDTEDMKIHYVTRYQKRGSNSNFIGLIINNWSNWIGEMEIEEWPVHYQLSSPDFYMSDILKDIYDMNKDWLVYKEDYKNITETKIE